MNIQRGDYFYHAKQGSFRVVGFTGSNIVLVAQVFDDNIIKVLPSSDLQTAEWEFCPYDEMQSVRIKSSAIIVAIGVFFSLLIAFIYPTLSILSIVIILTVSTYAYTRIMGYLADKKLHKNGVIHDRDKSRLDKKGIVVS